MVQLQILCRTLSDGDMSFVIRNGFTKDYFFEFPDEFAFIEDHAKKYGNAPDLPTFLAKFPDFEYVDVRESDSYLSEKMREEMAFHRAVPLIEKAYSMLEGNAFDAVNFLQSRLPELLKDTSSGAIDLVADSAVRENSLDVRMKSEDKGSVTTGFKELDSYLKGGWRLNGDLVAVIARPGVGKTWMLLAFLTAAWREGYTVGMYSGEMPAEEIGYRYDSLLTHVSNSDLEGATMLKGVDEYKGHLKRLREGDYAPFYVITQDELGGRPTVSQLENFCKAHSIDVLGVDQYTLMRDERSTKTSETKDQLEHISSDLRTMALRNRMLIIAANQSNRNGAKPTKDKPCPTLEDIYGSDSIGQNSSRVVSLGQMSSNSIAMQVIKNRHGNEGKTFVYLWDVDHGTFTYQPDVGNPDDREAVEAQRREYQGEGDVF